MATRTAPSKKQKKQAGKPARKPRRRSSVEPLATSRPRRLAKYGRRPRNPAVG